jgi:hypothetical protein
MESIESFAMALPWIVTPIAAYMLPSIVAHARQQPNLAAILALNVLLGWTVIGWVIALVWALTVRRA